MIVSFADRDTERLFHRERPRRLDARLHRKALVKLLLLDAAQEVSELRVPPGNRLKALRGDRAGEYSIRINDHWRICFAWTAAGPRDVEIVDYH